MLNRGLSYLSEVRLLLNNRPLIFLFCIRNMKQLYFRHFNINSKKLTVIVIVFQKELKRPILFCWGYLGVLCHFPTISDYVRRFPKTAESFQRLPKMSEECRWEIRNFWSFHLWKIHILVYRYDFFSKSPPKTKENFLWKQ